MRKILFAIIYSALSYIIHAQALYSTTARGGTNGGGTICKLENGRLTAVFNFDAPDGSTPYGSLVQASDGNLYGTASTGGKYHAGIIFSYNPATHKYLKLKDFDNINGSSPSGNLIQAKDGKLYGITGAGGKNNDGVIFSYQINNGLYTKLKDFNEISTGSRPSGGLVQGNNGKLYGMTSFGGSQGGGVIFSYDPVTHVYIKLKEFNNSKDWYPVGSLLKAKDGKLYGLTQFSEGGGGSIFSVDPITAVYKKLEDFQDTLGHPYGSLIQASDRKLYGMTGNGGSDDKGAIFSYNITTSAFAKLKDFYTSSGSNPYGSLLQAKDGKLYGMTSNGGKGLDARGVAFSFNISTNEYRVLKDFNRLDGNWSYNGFMQAADGKLYGMTTGGGGGGCGVLFSLDIPISGYTKLRDFGINITGYNTQGGLVKDSMGILYGATLNGGVYGSGIIFSFDPTTSFYKKLKDLNYANEGKVPCSMMQAKDGKIYGMTSYGGTYDGGIIFSFNPVNAAYAKLKDFRDSTGSRPSGNLIQANDGKLYGMTNAGGNNYVGVIFSYDPTTGIYKKLKDFADSTGKDPYGSLIQATDGKLYGMTSDGGKGSNGVIFCFDVNTSSYTTLIDFNYRKGTSTTLIDFNYRKGTRPLGSLVQAKDGKLYGTTSTGGDHIYGVLFSYDIARHVYTKLKDFTDMEGMSGERLMQASDGKLYGISARRFSVYSEAPYNPGVAYCFDPVTFVFTKLQNFDNATGKDPGYTFFTEIPRPRDKDK